MDWILLGVLSTSVILAEYSFTNKLFELFLLPLLIIGPVLFPSIVKAVSHTKSGKMDHLKSFIKIEVIFAVLVALIVNACWKDVINLVTDDKYGDSTSVIIFVMCLAMPLAYINNFFWSINFAKGNMRIIFLCILVTCGTNIVFNFLLIPYFSGLGAAIAFVLANIVQVLYYSLKSNILNNRLFFYHTLLVYGNGLIAGFLARYFFTGAIPQGIFSITMYFVLLLVTGQLKIKDWRLLKKTAFV